MFFCFKIITHDNKERGVKYVGGNRRGGGWYVFSEEFEIYKDILRRNGQC